MSGEGKEDFGSGNKYDSTYSNSNHNPSAKQSFGCKADDSKEKLNPLHSHSPNDMALLKNVKQEPMDYDDGLAKIHNTIDVTENGVKESFPTPTTCSNGTTSSTHAHLIKANVSIDHAQQPQHEVKTLSSAPTTLPLNLGILFSSDSSSSCDSDSSSESSSDDEVDYHGGNAGSEKVVLNLDEKEVPKQLMMKCSVVLRRIDITGYPLPLFSTLPSFQPPVDLSLVKAEPVSPTDMATTYNFNTPLKVKAEPLSPTNLLIHKQIDSFLPNKKVVNTIRETKARPLSKIKSHGAAATTTKTLAPLTKIKAAQPSQPKQESPIKENRLSGMDIVDLLRRCQLCRVLLVDCMKGLSKPVYNLPTIEDEYVEKYRKSMKEKKRKKHKKLKPHKESEVDERPSKTRNKKHKVKGERRRIRIEVLSSDDEHNSNVSNKDQIDRKRKSSDSVDKLSRAEKVRLLAEKIGGVKSKAAPEVKREEAKPKEKSSPPLPQRKFVSPWSEAIATCGLPKIPKIKKIEPTNASNQVSSTATTNQPLVNPYERVKKREERRREFEKMAAAKYGTPHPPSQSAYQQGPPSTNMWSTTKTFIPQTTPSSTSTASKSPVTPTYTIPRPPIPGEVKNVSQPVPLPVPPPPTDPRALLPTPGSSRTPPSAIIPTVLKPTAKSKIALLPEPKPLLEEPDCLLPTPESLFAGPSALLPDPSAVGSEEKRVKPLLSSPGLLPKPKALLPSPQPSAEDLARTQARHEQFRDILDADDWKIISEPTAPIPKWKRESAAVVSSTTSSGDETSHRNSKHKHSKREKSHHKSPSSQEINLPTKQQNPDISDNSHTEIPDVEDENSVNQDVLEEICRLSLEISKRIAKKTSAAAPVLPSDPAPALPAEPAPLPTEEAPRAPTPPPSLQPPPLPPALLPPPAVIPSPRQPSGAKQVLEEDLSYQDQSEYDDYNDDTSAYQDQQIPPEEHYDSFSQEDRWRRHSDQYGYRSDRHDPVSQRRYRQPDQYYADNPNETEGSIITRDRYGLPVISNEEASDDITSAITCPYQEGMDYTVTHNINEQIGLSMMNATSFDSTQNAQESDDQTEAIMDILPVSQELPPSTETECQQIPDPVLQDHKPTVNVDTDTLEVPMDIDDSSSSHSQANNQANIVLSPEQSLQSTETSSPTKKVEPVNKPSPAHDSLMAQTTEMNSNEPALPILSQIAKTLNSISCLVTSTKSKKGASITSGPELVQEDQKIDTLAATTPNSDSLEKPNSDVEDSTQSSEKTACAKKDHKADTVLAKPVLRKRVQVSMWLTEMDEQNLEVVEEAAESVVDKTENAKNLSVIPIEELQARLAQLTKQINSSKVKPSNKSKPTAKVSPLMQAHDNNSEDNAATHVDIKKELTQHTTSNVSEKGSEEANSPTIAVLEVSNSAPVSGSSKENDSATTDQPEAVQSANFFLMLNSDSQALSSADGTGTAIPGLMAYEKTREEYEAEVGKPKWQYPLAVPELFEELSELVKIILDNRSNAEVLKALVRICIIHNTENFTFRLLKRRNPNITDLSSIYNKALINLLADDDKFWVVTAAGLQKWLSELTIHPLVLQSLLRIHENLLQQP